MEFKSTQTASIAIAGKGKWWFIDGDCGSVRYACRVCRNGIFFCSFYTAAASKMIEAGRFYVIIGHDIKYTMNNNIDVEHI